MKALDEYHAGNLSGAIAAATDEVKRRPADPEPRFLLGELLGFTGAWEQADRQLDALGFQNPAMMPGIHQWRQVIRAEQARQQFFTDGRVPEFLSPPSPAVRLLLEASIAVREANMAEASRLLAEAEACRPRVSGQCDGRPFADLRDMDDRLSLVLEVVAGTGHYYWVALDQVESIEFEKPLRPRDVLWRQARLVVRDGPDGVVFLPSLYPGAAGLDDDRLRLGRMTDWLGGAGEPFRGRGLRMIQVDDLERPFLELESITVNAPAP
jgi:type VI secretion system protein ImpE